MSPDFKQRLDDLWGKSAHGTRREDLEAAFKLGVESERERCARIADTLVDGWSSADVAYKSGVETCREIATAIRRVTSETL